MESFLTLSDGDLSELGITRKDARQQILTTIAELNCSKVPYYMKFLRHVNFANFAI